MKKLAAPCSSQYLAWRNEVFVRRGRSRTIVDSMEARRLSGEVGSIQIRRCCQINLVDGRGKAWLALYSVGGKDKGKKGSYRNISGHELMGRPDTRLEMMALVKLMYVLV